MLIQEVRRFAPNRASPQYPLLVHQPQPTVVTPSQKDQRKFYTQHTYDAYMDNNYPFKEGEFVTMNSIETRLISIHSVYVVARRITTLPKGIFHCRSFYNGAGDLNSLFVFALTPEFPEQEFPGRVWTRWTAPTMLRPLTAADWERLMTVSAHGPFPATIHNNMPITHDYIQSYAEKWLPKAREYADAELKAIT
jgi:hypothetical protein